MKLNLDREKAKCPNCGTSLIGCWGPNPKCEKCGERFEYTVTCVSCGVEIGLRESQAPCSSCGKDPQLRRSYARSCFVSPGALVVVVVVLVLGGLIAFLVKQLF